MPKQTAAPVERLCYRCVGDPFLSAEVRADGKSGTCMQCGKKRTGLEFSELADRIDAAIQQNFQPARNDEGQDYGGLVAEQAGLNSDIGERIYRWFSNRSAYAAAHDGEENIYEAAWVEGGLDREPHSQRWRQFKRSVREEARFFNDQAETWLTDIFHKIDEQVDWRGQKAVREITPGDADAIFYRGRVAHNEAELKALLRDSAGKLGPPPNGTASAGRMNAAGVSVFYGAFDLPTCRAEIRPPVGSHAVFARFALARPVRILDFRALNWMAVEGSIFDPTYNRRLERAAFLRTFGHEVSEPVMPGDEPFGYLPTQIVADFLAQSLGLDGILFQSTQSGGTTQNVTLFNRAARVAPVDSSGYETEIDLGWREPDDYDDRITIREEELPPPLPSPPPPEKSSFELTWIEPPDPDGDHREVSLSLVPDSIEVHRIDAVDYRVHERQVASHRWTRKRLEDQSF